MTAHRRGYQVHRMMRDIMTYQYRQHSSQVLDLDSGRSEAYLSDAEGRQVTPWIKTPPRLTATYDQQPQLQQSAPSFGRGRGWPPVDRATLERRVLDAEERLRTKKRTLGIGLDKGGATLVTDERRLTLIDDEDFERIIDDGDWRSEPD